MLVELSDALRFNQDKLYSNLISTQHGFSLVALWSSADDLASRRCLAAREGKIIPMICDDNLDDACRIERHVCVNTTAAGGNTSLLAAVS